MTLFLCPFSLAVQFENTSWSKDEQHCSNWCFVCLCRSALAYLTCLQYKLGTCTCTCGLDTCTCIWVLVLVLVFVLVRVAWVLVLGSV